MRRSAQIRGERGRARIGLGLLLGMAGLAMMLSGASVFGGGPGVDAASVAPVFVEGNPTCASLNAGWTELKVQTIADGSYNDGTLFVTVDFGGQGRLNSWSSNIGVDAVIMKGGPVANVYYYNPESIGDTNLVTPTNPSNGDPYGTSHVSFCYDLGDPTATPTSTSTATATATSTSTSTPTSTGTPVTPTNTPVTPTNTPVTPTNTPVTPTNTPVTPTNTPVTPTNTPLSQVQSVVATATPRPVSEVLPSVLPRAGSGSGSDGEAWLLSMGGLVLMLFGGALVVMRGATREQ